MMIRIRTVLVATLLVAGLAACGSSSSGSPSGGGSGSSGAVQSGTAKVTIQGFAFHPASLTVKPGTKVTFTNEDSTTHTATATGANAFNSGDLKKGQSYTMTFTKAGTYSYICTFHNYMHGTVIVKG